METLIVTAEHRNHHQYYEKRSRFRSAAPSKSFKQINCRTFHSGAGLLPKPQSPLSPKSVLPVFNIDNGHRSSPIQIRRSCSEFVDKRRSFSYSELWAGPTYSNSPPPTSVPMPKFSLKQKRTVSLPLLSADSDSGVEIREVAKSAPVSPTSAGDHNHNPFHCTVFATMTLRRMLNLEFADE